MTATLLYTAVGFSLLSFCLVISGAASPWLGFTAPNSPSLTFGLLSFCSGGNCVSMTQAPFTGDLCELKVTAAFLFISFIFSFFSFLTGAAMATGSDAAIADSKLKIVFSLTALFTAFTGGVIGCNQVYSYYQSQNNQFISLDSAPKYVLMPGFSCTIAAILMLLTSVVIDVLVARAGRGASAPSLAKAPTAAAPTLRATSPAHISQYIVTSPLSQPRMQSLTGAAATQ